MCNLKKRVPTHETRSQNLNKYLVNKKQLFLGKAYTVSTRADSVPYAQFECCIPNQQISTSILHDHLQWVALTLFRMGILGLFTDVWGEQKGPPLHKICHRYPAMVKLGTVIPYLKIIEKIYINHVAHSQSSANISIFSPEISKFCYIKKYRYRLDFDT